MIKTFDQFVTIEEGLFGSKKNVDFYKQFSEMINNCLDSMVEFVKAAKNEVDLSEAEDNVIFVYEGKVNDKKNVTYSVALKSVKVVKDSDIDVAYKNDNGEFLVAITEKGDKFPVDVEHVDDSSIFYLSRILASLKK